MHLDSVSAQQSRPLARSAGLLLVLDTPKGRGIFASQFIAKGTIVEVSPVLVFTQEEVEKHTSQTCLQHYTYYWPCPNGNATTQAIALGLGSMFNHTRTKQNVVWSRDLESQCIVYTAHQDIESGDELCISYGDARLWFDDADGPDSDDEWTKLRDRETENDTAIGFAVSGIGNIEL